ncbi:MAG: enoyl-CoA hydratase [Firmicutes bacterium HGW-Firmicutes-15]|nr:MAG: enoyl-CoA hydratase [Firmicutes bacterium HGW-Firmicutes-15]
MSYRDEPYQFIKVTIEDDIAIVQYNRPEALNAANAQLVMERNDAIYQAGIDPEIKVLIMTGNDKAYSAGGGTNLPKPTIAMIAGFCFGGGFENALSCDLRIAADNAKFALPEINVGIYPGAGATQRLPQHVSLCKAKELVFLGETFDAQTALDLGLINKVVPLAELRETTMAVARKLAKKPAFSLRMAKEALNAAWSTSLEKGMQIETHGWAMTYGTKDAKEGMNAFLEKRKPVYTGE